VQSTKPAPNCSQVDDGPSASGNLADKLRSFAALTPDAQVAYLAALPKAGEQLTRSEAIRLGIERRKIAGLPIGKPPAALTAGDLRALELRLQGQTWGQIVATLTAENYASHNGKAWNPARARHAVSRATKAQGQT